MLAMLTFHIIIVETKKNIIKVKLIYPAAIIPPIGAARYFVKGWNKVLYDWSYSKKRSEKF